MSFYVSCQIRLLALYPAKIHALKANTKKCCPFRKVFTSFYLSFFLQISFGYWWKILILDFIYLDKSAVTQKENDLKPRVPYFYWYCGYHTYPHLFCGLHNINQMWQSNLECHISIDIVDTTPHTHHMLILMPVLRVIFIATTLFHQPTGLVVIFIYLEEDAHHTPFCQKARDCCSHNIESSITAKLSV